MKVWCPDGESVEGHRVSAEVMDAPSLRINATIENENAMVILLSKRWNGPSIVAHYLIDHLDLEFVGGLVDDRSSGARHDQPRRSSSSHSSLR